ncbi:putative macro domain-containing protein-like isoform 2 [Capsicum annuum]|nr:putative macro domain-containing protein-like isoform 2 [Capsicum annuum]
MSPTTTYHKFYSRLLRIRFLPTLNTPRNFQSSHLHSSRNFYPANSIHTLIRPISLISINLPSSTAVVRGSISTIAGVSTMASGGGNGGDSVTFRLTPTSSLKIQKGDITQWSVDGSSDAISILEFFFPIWEVSIRSFIDPHEKRIFVPSEIRDRFALKIVKYFRGSFSKNTRTTYEEMRFGRHLLKLDIQEYARTIFLCPVHKPPLNPNSWTLYNDLGELTMEAPPICGKQIFMKISIEYGTCGEIVKVEEFGDHHEIFV